MRGRYVANLLTIATLVALVIVLGVRSRGPNTLHDRVVIDASLVVTHTAKAWGDIPNLALRRARAYWNSDRCADPITLHYRLLRTLEVARADWSYNGRTPVLYLNCTITFGLTRQLSFRYYCAAMIHEYGHLHGFFERGGLDFGAHSRNPRNIMYPKITDRNIPRICGN